MPRPNHESSTQVAGVMTEYGVSEEVARWALSLARAAYDMGREEGQVEAQRFFRLALGIEEATSLERAYWNNPVPLRPEEPDLGYNRDERP